ncbi:MAG: ABC transporter ATP-binding protein [Paracoccaceae bacterium]|nr:ABC transporter ATP-binding protein [Paracoccaceae bacterium]
MTGAVLKVENLCKSFGALPVSDAVNLEVKSGEIHAIIGPNGAGKSTLIGQIAGGLSPDTGSIFLNGQDITGLKMAHRAQLGLGRTFQISSLAMEMSVLENTILGAIGQRQDAHRFWSPVSRNAALGDIAMTALAAVGLSAHADQVVATLSHGQRRQLEVAVALTLRPKVFLMDEPMAGLGSEGTKTMTGFLDRLRQKAPILLVEHDMDAVFALADRISVLVYGKIIATGSVEDIRKNPEVRAAYLGNDEPAS